jgi:cell shape-determining protein MreC
LEEKEKKIQSLKKDNKLSSVASRTNPDSLDGPAQMRLEALQRQCEALEWELVASRELKVENEKLKKQVAAQKAYMVNLQNLNDSLRNMSDL